MKKIYKWFLLFVLVFITCELFSYLYIFIRHDKLITPYTLFQNKYTNKHKIGDDGCIYYRALIPHPYLTFTYRSEGPCKKYRAQRGFFSQTIPDVKLKDKYVIMISGGSAAEGLYYDGWDKGPYLQRYLNENYKSPNGMPFYIINTSMGGKRWPDQLINFILHHQIIDAFITLDGFNEYNNHRGLNKFSINSLNFKFLNPLFLSPKDQLAEQFFSKLKFFESNLPLKYSAFIYVIFDSLSEFLLTPMINNVNGSGLYDLFKKQADFHSYTSDENKKNYLLNQHLGFIEFTHNMAKLKNIKTAFFLQPILAIQKSLTDKEKAILKSLYSSKELNRFKKSYTEVYNFLTSNSNNLPVISLLSAFQDYKEEIYIDNVHVHELKKKGPALGNQVLTKKIVDHLAELWNLERVNQ